MRIKTSSFGERAGHHNKLQVKPKYFLAFEGYKTEPIYFEAIQENRTLLNINPLIELHQVDREQTGGNHPLDIIKNVDEYMQTINDTDNITYDARIDKVCIIVDRDKKSFIIKQLRKAIKKCEEKSFRLFLSNPCFEFWLLLHYDEVHDINNDELLENKKEDNQTFAERELKKLCIGYQKGEFPIEWFIENINKAIENEKSFAEDLEQLKESVGSNIGKLIEELREN
ncbi:MAG: hypothetical protein ATN35_06715 [Epulopiscium sp. Nele67-Bin004]|nr:MAG: hypothetical protein ATN35_06715 [Epulopiscium sp. Nele67-Bin004]